MKCSKSLKSLLDKLRREIDEKPKGRESSFKFICMINSDSWQKWKTSRLWMWRTTRRQNTSPERRDVLWREVEVSRDAWARVEWQTKRMPWLVSSFASSHLETEGYVCEDDPSTRWDTCLMAQQWESDAARNRFGIVKRLILEITKDPTDASIYGLASIERSLSRAGIWGNWY